MKLFQLFIAFCITLPSPTLLSDPVHSLAPRSEFSLDPRGRVIIALTPSETESLSPKYKSVQDFWSHYHKWQQAHPNARLRWFIRHGESTSNVLDFTQYPGIYTPLTFRGRKQAKIMAEFLQRVPITKYYASHLERAYMTLWALAKRQGRSAARINVDNRLQEIIFWPAGGMPFIESKTVFKELENLYHTDPENYTVPGISSFKNSYMALQVLLKEVEKMPERNIAFGSHGMAITFAVMVAFNIPIKKYWTVRTRLGNPPNASVTLMAYDPDQRKWELLVFGDNSYLSNHLKKSSSKLFVALEHYAWAIARLLFAPLRLHSRELADYSPSRATFFRLSPHSVKNALEKSMLIATAA